MVGSLLLMVSLSVGQTDPTANDESPASGPVIAMPDRWIMMKSLQGTYPGWILDGNRVQVYGWTDSSYTGSSAAIDNLPLGLNYRANELIVQQNWLRIDRPAATSGTSEPSFGFRVDTILPGTDYRFTLPRGLFNQQLTANDGEPNLYGIDPVQFYVETFVPTVGQGLSLKLGRMFCQFGYEATDAPSNALASHSYTFFYDPFTQTGLMGTLQLTPAWSVQVGALIGPDVFIDPADSPYSMFSVKWAPPDGRQSVLVSGLIGSGRYDVNEQFNNPNVVDLVYTRAIGSRLTYALDALVGWQSDVPDIGNAWWYGIVNYLTYKLSPRLSTTGRLELFDDIDGNRTGFAGLYTALTGGLNFKPHRAITIRPELRFDYNGESRPFEDKHGLLTATTDVIVRW